MALDIRQRRETGRSLRGTSAARRQRSCHIAKPQLGRDRDRRQLRAWDRPESIEFLRKRTSDENNSAADALADALGDLPLALAQAAAYIEKTRTTYEEYLELFLSRRRDLWGEEDKPLGYNETIATTWGVAISEIRHSRPEAAKLLELFATLGSGSVASYRSLARKIPGALSDPITFNHSVAALRSFSLIERNGDQVFVHPLVRKVISDGFGEKFDREAVERPGQGAMVPTKLGCPYPRCPSNDGPTFDRLVGGIGECGSCGRLVVECTEPGCRGSGTFNRPFVRHCRRCGARINQTAQWETARFDGWHLVPRSITAPQVIADLSGLADNSLSGSEVITTAMVRGALAVHRSGRFLSLLRVVPAATGDPFLWEMEWYPFPASPDGSHPAPYPPMLLSGDRYLMYSCPQGMLVLDLWSCPRLSAKSNESRYRLIRCRRRSLATAPIPLGESRIGLLTRDWTKEGHFEWAVWDLSNKDLTDAAFSSRLDSEETQDAAPLSWIREGCRVDLVDDRIVAFSTPGEQRVWRKEDAIASDFDKMKTTWQYSAIRKSESLLLGEHEDALESVGPPRCAFLLEPGEERFSCFMCVGQDDPTNPKPIERYEVDFDTLRATVPQAIELPSGAIPIGSAPSPDKFVRMYFREGSEIWYHNDRLDASYYQSGLPQVLVSLRLNGPLVLSVGENDQGQRSIQIDSLRHRNRHANVLIENILLSEPILWYHWLCTIEVDADNRLLAYRRIVTFN